MTNYYLRVKGGEAIVLQLKPQKIQLVSEQLHSIFKVIDILSNIVRPLVINLDLACRLINEPYIDPDVDPLNPNHQICESVEIEDECFIPANVDTKKISTKVVSKITNEVLLNWSEQALNQKMPSERHCLTLDTLKSKYTKTHLFLDDEARHDDYISLQDNGSILRIPVEKQDGEIWVKGSTDGLLQYAPIEMEFLNHDGWLSFYLWVSWGPSWLSPSTQEHKNLETSLARIITQGWEPASVPDVFNLQ